jgi:hypothetical protein
MIQLLRDRELEAFRHTYRTLFNRVLERGEDVHPAHQLVAKHFAKT